MPGKRGGVTLKELQAKAKAAKVKGWSKMNKAELMQRVGGGGGGGAGAPQRKKGVPVTTAKRYEAKGVAGKIVSKIGANLTDSGKKNLEAVLMKRVKSATDKARRQPGATDQSVRKAAAGAVKDVVRDVRSQSNSKRTRAGNPTRQQQALEKRLFQERDQNADATLARQRARERAYMERSFAEEEGVVPKRQRKSKKSSAKPVAAPNDEAKRRAEIEAKNRARTEALRAKHGGDAVARAQAYREKGRGNKDKYQAGVRLVRSAASRQDNSRIDGAITRTELDRTQKALNRRARKTGKQVSVTRNLDYNPGEGKRDIHKATLTGSTEKGGMESRRPKQATAKTSKTTAGTPQKQKSSTRKSSTASTPQKQKKTRSTATTSRKKGLTDYEKKKKLVRVSGVATKIEARRARLQQEITKARNSGDRAREEKLRSRMDTLKQRRRRVKNLEGRLARETDPFRISIPRVKASDSDISIPKASRKKK